MKKKLLLWLFSLLLLVGFGQADWYYNPATGQIDYYEPVSGANFGDLANVNLAGVIAGGVLYYDGTRWVYLATGANGEILTLAAGIPSWAASAGGAPIAGQYLTLVLNGVLTAERVLTAGTGISFTDTGANGTLTVWTQDGQIDHDSLLNYVAGDHIGLPAMIATVLTDHDLGAHTGLGLAITAHAMATHSDEDTYNISTSGTAGTGEITVADGGGINLQEDITFTGATTENLIKFPDNLAEALVLEEAGTSYQTFVTTNGSEEIQMNVGVQFDTIAYFTAEYDEGAEGGAFTIDWTNGQKQKVTITGVNLDMSFTDPPGPCNLMLTIVQGDGDDTIDWTHDTKIGGAGGTAPTLSTGNADTDVIGIYFDGTNYWISVMLDTDLFT